MRVPKYVLATQLMSDRKRAKCQKKAAAGHGSEKEEELHRNPEVTDWSFRTPRRVSSFFSAMSLLLAPIFFFCYFRCSWCSRVFAVNIIKSAYVPNGSLIMARSRQRNHSKKPKQNSGGKTPLPRSLGGILQLK